MISLTRLSGTAFLINADLVERVDCTPDTVVTLVDGTKYLVSESLDDVREAVLGYRAAIIARANQIDAGVLPGVSPSPSAPARGAVRSPRLSAVPSTDESDNHRGGRS